MGPSTMDAGPPPPGRAADGVAARLAADRGAATVLTVGVAAALVAVSVMAVAILGLFVASARAANAADAAALAAADAASGAVAGVPCELADRAAVLGGAVLVACAVEGPVATVSVEVDAGAFTAPARSRAGPPGWVG